MRDHVIKLLSIINDEKRRGSLIYDRGSFYDRTIKDAQKAVIASRPTTITEDVTEREDAMMGVGQ